MSDIEKTDKKNSQGVNKERVKRETGGRLIPLDGIIIPNKKSFKPKDILRIQSQLIRGFISGKVYSDDAKTLSYLCSNYLSNVKDVLLEERIKKIEDKLSNKK